MTHQLSAQEVKLAQAALERPESIRLADLPAGIGQLLREALEEMGRGHAVRVLPVAAELTTQEAAEILGISRPTMVRLLDEGRIPSWKVGTHRRVRLEDVTAFAKTQEGVTAQALQELADLDQELDLL